MSLEQERGQTRSSIFVTVLVVAIGFALLVVPVSIMSLAQTGALLGKRMALFLQLAAGAILLSLGLFLQASTLILGGLVALALLPVVALALWIRSTGKSPWWALGAFLAPVFLILTPVLFAPQIPADQFDERVMVPLRAEIATQSKELDPAVLKSMEDSLQVFATSEPLKAYLAKTPDQRLSWFVLSETGSGILFLMLISAFASLLMLDVGYSQIYRLQALYMYTKSDAGKSLPGPFIQGLQGAMEGKNPSRMLGGSGRAEYLIVSHKTPSEEKPTSHDLGEGKLLPSAQAMSRIFFRPQATWGVFRWYGYNMNYQLTSTPGWHLSLFALPLPLILGAVAILCGVVFLPSVGFEKQLQDVTGVSALLLATFSVICYLALQGMNVFYRRVRTLWAFVLIFILFAFSVQMSYTAYSLMAIFGIVGLLDYLYQWRLPKGYFESQKV